MGETSTAIKLAEAELWSQLWTDATPRRQIPVTSLIIGLLSDDNSIDPAVLSSCILMEVESSGTGTEGIF